MITTICLCHPQSADLLDQQVFMPNYSECIRIACGTSKVPNADLSEAGDFFPTYASWNSSLFETSVILTVWEHADQLIGTNDVAILHSDVKPHFEPLEIWRKLHGWLSEKPHRPIGLTVPVSQSRAWTDWLIPDDVILTPSNDPMLLHSFDYNIHVWDYIKLYDRDIHEWAFDTQPNLIYAHQFCCSRLLFDDLASRLYVVAKRLRLADVGFWTPHMFERLIALYLVRYGGEPLLSTCFWHYASSGIFGPGELSLYGPRPRRYYQLVRKYDQGTQPVINAKNAASIVS